MASELGIVAPQAAAATCPAEALEREAVVFPGPSVLPEGPGELSGTSTVLVQERGPVEEGRGAAAEAPEKRALRRRRKRRHKGRPSPEAEAREGTSKGRAVSAALEQPAAAPTDEASEAIADPTADLPEPQRSKRRRSRRSGQKRKRSAELQEGVLAQPVGVAGAEEEEFLSGEELPEQAEALAEQPHEASENDRSGKAGGGDESKPGHRAIPTWEEAIGVIVTANLEARAKRPGGGSSRPRNGGRGATDQRRPGRKPSGHKD